MTIGISVYPGLDSRKSLEESVALAIKENLKYLFLSLHIPEADQTTFSEDLEYVLSLSRKNHINVIADMTPETKKLFGKQVVFIKRVLASFASTTAFCPMKLPTCLMTPPWP